MKDLIAFLKARYDEAEEMATFARGQVPLRRPGDGRGHARPRRVDEQALDMYTATFRPERMLADIQAKRRILAAWPDPFGTWTAEQADAARAVKEQTLRLLALPYAGHYDYREEWRP